MMGWGYNGYGNCLGSGMFSGFGGLIFMGLQLLFLLAILYLGYKFIKGTTAGSNDNSALALLEERLVRGEITEEEFTKKKQVLKQK